MIRRTGLLALLAFGMTLSAGAPTNVAVAGMLDWIRFPGVCYDYDPYDQYRRFGKYYPYSGEKCRRRLKSVEDSEESEAGNRSARCIRSNIRNQKNACPS
jgi:hypothetical protein